MSSHLSQPPRFAIFQDSTLLGWTALESSDPPMGVACGQFFVTPAYASVQEQVRARNGTDQSDLHLVAYHLGQPLPAMAVSILDLRQECGEDAIEVSVLGIAYPLYQQLFPEAVAAYEQQALD
ncbi:hypothetical protein [Pseudomonas sessilinigenes]|uniref:Uncharacterized protein n=1 Tax=Pseudomonas sessilinigenes TaxID=658629 RepID=A0ABX8MQH9_9PSED|nr:hypothetical protein [Pseudomonas sessilinigenes]AZC22474.1 hypothetical protein C4K39_0776 [Pseudomonas sessilinigenes]QXH41539.1 hypothetical protein KSS89_04770 [Pseudomonas sessilinigenes]